MSFLTLKNYVSSFDIPFWVFENYVPKFVFQKHNHILGEAEFSQL